MMIDDDWWWLMMIDDDDDWWWLMMIDDDDWWWWLMMIDDDWWWWRSWFGFILMTASEPEALVGVFSNCGRRISEDWERHDRDAARSEGQWNYGAPRPALAAFAKVFFSLSEFEFFLFVLTLFKWEATIGPSRWRRRRRLPTFGCSVWVRFDWLCCLSIEIWFCLRSWNGNERSHYWLDAVSSRVSSRRAGCKKTKTKKKSLFFLIFLSLFGSQRLFAEISALAPEELEEVSPESAPYLYAVVHETLRVHPAVVQVGLVFFFPILLFIVVMCIFLFVCS